MPSDINFIATIAHTNFIFIIIRRLTIASERVIPFLRYIAASLTSLAKNFDSLLNILKGLHDKFSVIGLAEIKFQFDQDPILTGYTSISQPSFSNNGSAGFFMKNDLKYFIRDDLTDSKDEY